MTKKEAPSMQDAIASATATAVAEPPASKPVPAAQAVIPIEMAPEQRVEPDDALVVRRVRHVVYEWTKTDAEGKSICERCVSHLDPRWTEMDPVKHVNRIQAEARQGGSMTTSIVGYDASGREIERTIETSVGRSPQQARDVLKDVLTGKRPEATWK